MTGKEEEHPVSTVPKPFVFVLMPFDESFDDIYKFGIQGAADDVGAYAERVDKQIFTEGILERIFNQISKADVIVADMTRRNPNVFYEVGYAHALGKTVLLLTQDTNDIPFDLQHRQHTVYGGKIEILRRELAARLTWAIGESRGRTRVQAERFALRFQGIEASQTDTDDLPILTGYISKRDFVLNMALRNDSAEKSQEITHVYLYSSPLAKLIPIYKPEGTFVYAVGSALAKEDKLQSLPSFRASPRDSPDGLTTQYRLDTKFPPLPPGAVELTEVHFTLALDSDTCDERIRIRISSIRRADLDIRQQTLALDRRLVGCKPQGDGNAQLGAVRQIMNVLDRPFAKALLPDQYRAITVAQRARHHLRCTGAPAIDQCNERNPFCEVARIRAVDDLISIPSTLLDNDSLIKKQIAHAHRLVQQSTGVATQVQDQSLRSLF